MIPEKNLDLSIIIVTFNTVDLTLDCLASIRERVRGLSYEIIIADNNSRDGTSQAIEQNYPDAVLIRNKENIGFAKANNQAIKISKGRIILLLNSDTLICDDSIQKILLFMSENSEIGILSPKLKNFDGTTQLFGCGYFPTVRRIFNQLFLFARLLKKSSFFRGVNKYTLDSSGYVDWVASTAMFIKREVIQLTGGLPEHYFMYLEDVEFCYVARQNGIGVYFKHDCSIKHLGMGSSYNMLETKKRWLANLMDFCGRISDSPMRFHLARTVVFSGLVFRIIIQTPCFFFSKRCRQNISANWAMLSVFINRKDKMQ